MNKQGQSATILQTIPRLIFLVVVLFSIMLLVRQYVVDSLNVQEVQAEVFMNRIVYSPNGISFQDNQIGTTPGFVDKSRITNKVLDDLMDYKDENFIAGKVELYSISNQKIVQGIYNEKTYTRWLPVAQTGRIGQGGVAIFRKSLLVNYVDDAGNKVPGILRMEVLLPGRTQ